MAAYYLDSSAAAKLYVVERGTPWLTSLLEPTRQPEVFIVRITAVEVAAALFRRVRAAALRTADAASVLAALRLDLERTYRVIELTLAVAEEAFAVAERHGLRGYDCVQLAAALITQRHRVAAGLSPLNLVSADTELNSAAKAEGLTVEDPNDHPE